MGRYSLDKPGLIYANAAGVGFDKTQYTKLAADEDGIIPVTDLEWFADDAANRSRNSCALRGQRKLSMQIYSSLPTAFH